MQLYEYAPTNKQVKQILTQCVTFLKAEGLFFKQEHLSYLYWLCSILFQMIHTQIHTQVNISHCTSIFVTFKEIIIAKIKP